MVKDITRNYKDKEIIKRLVLFAKPYTKQFIIGFILTIILVLIDLVPPLLQGQIIGFLRNDTLSNNNILLYCFFTYWWLYFNSFYWLFY